MSEKLDDNRPGRPSITEFSSIASYLSATVRWLKLNHPGFTLRKRAQALSISPSLVTLILKGERRLTRDRVETIGTVLGLNRREIEFLDRWVALSRKGIPQGTAVRPESISAPIKRGSQNSLLTHWLNPYVKSAAFLKGFRPEARVISRLLNGLAPLHQIERSLRFLQTHGYLRKTMTGEWVVDDAVATTTNGAPDSHIRASHKRALDIARRGIDLHPVDRRKANAVILSLSRDKLGDLFSLVDEFYEKLLSIAQENPAQGELLFQVIVHATPIGGEDA